MPAAAFTLPRKMIRTTEMGCKWAVTEKFKDYLWGATFTVYTDNRPLTHLQTATLGATEQRWQAQLANFNFQLCYRPGSVNQNADALSRLPVEACSQLVDAEHPQRSHHETNAEAPGVENEGEDWTGIQEQDPDLRRIRQWKQEGRLEQHLDPQLLTPGGRRLLREWERLHLQDGILTRQSKDPATGQRLSPVVVPVREQRKVWTAYHQTFGHARGQRMVEVLRGRIFWSGLTGDSRRWEKECHQCVVGRPGQQEKASLHPVVSHYPFEILAMDYLSLGRVSDSHPNILVITDVFSRYAFAVPTRDQSALTTAKALWKNVIQVFGCPERIHSDQGGAFESELMQELCQLYGCGKSRTTPYHPQGNGSCERFNKTLLGLLNTLNQEDQGRWAEQLPYLLQAYNNTPHSSTGLTPFYVIFGRHARLPLDVALGISSPEAPCPQNDWVKHHQEQLLAAHKQVQRYSQRRQEGDQRRYNQRAKACPLLPGERVLCRNFRRRARGKLGPFWVPDPWVVVSQLSPGLPVYKLRPKGKEGPIRTIHRNNIRPCPGSWMTEDPGRNSRGADRVSEVGFWPINVGSGSRHPGTSPVGMGDVPESRPPDVIEGGLELNVGNAVDSAVGLRRSARSTIGVPPARFGH